MIYSLVMMIAMITADTQPELIIITNPVECVPCRILEHELKVSAEIKDYTVNRLGVEHAQKYGVTSIPTMIIVENKQEVRRSGLLKGGLLKEFLRRR